MRVAFVPCFILSALLLACGGDDNADSEPFAPDGLDAARLLSDASLAVAGLQGFHFVLTQEDATIPLPSNLELESAEGDVVLPDRLAAELEAEIQDTNVSVDTIAIGGETWITNPFTRRWQKLNADLRNYADFGALLPALLPAIKDAAVIGEAVLDDVATYLVAGACSSAELQAALPFSSPGHEVRVEVWIGVEDSLPRRVRVIGRLISDESGDAVRQIDLTRLNQPVRINPP